MERGKRLHLSHSPTARRRDEYTEKRDEIITHIDIDTGTHTGEFYFGLTRGISFIDKDGEINYANTWQLIAVGCA